MSPNGGVAVSVTVAVSVMGFLSCSLAGEGGWSFLGEGGERLGEVVRGGEQRLTAVLEFESRREGDLLVETQGGFRHPDAGRRVRDDLGRHGEGVRHQL